MSAKQIYWNVAAGSSSSPPDGLACIGVADSKIILYLSDPDDPDAVLVDSEHEDVIGQNTVEGRVVSGLLVKLLNAEYDGGIWTLHLEYESEALVGDDLDHCHVCQAQCYDCATQLKTQKAVWVSGEVDPDWITSFEAFLADRTLDHGGLSTV